MSVNRVLHDTNAFPIILDAAGRIHVRVCVLTCPQSAPTPVNRSIDRSLLRLLAMRADGTPIPSEL
jgi:hypothetical protein